MVTRITSASTAGVLRACVIHPSAPSGLAPLVVLHGISRNADQLVDLFRPEAECSGRVVIVPHFEAEAWPDFQRPSRVARPDLALLALLTQIEAGDSGMRGPIDLFGHSGGAQLAHRFAMLYPNRIGRLHLAAAGWYCLPDASMPHPYGLAESHRSADTAWVRRHTEMLSIYVGLSVRLYVGALDLGRDNSLRKTASLDRIQGRTRRDRAAHYLTSFRRAAEALGRTPDITLTELPSVPHDVALAITQTGLARLVVAAENVRLTRAS
ncbi:alpha/beta hydrolase (plasmid) [Paracoccus liaowanqingii]|uniref:Alpha/beta hydrolase n=1 Tax=Paracoccus liaowanqingii TaxID=2560053 RepID=A0A4Y5STM4_9RHOB|nr:alpha/beta hydrolase [Paracoccus liaowanqingii]QDA36850.1 alpha/beta hydrolase [Paracoccus liaowanqingii]